MVVSERSQSGRVDVAALQQDEGRQGMTILASCGPRACDISRGRTASVQLYMRLSTDTSFSTAG